MRRYVAMSIRFLVIAFAATFVTEANWFGTQLWAQTCPETIAPTPKGPVTPDGPSIAAQCPEACVLLSTSPHYKRFGYDQNGKIDVVYVDCKRDSDGTVVATDVEIQSDFGDCWRCIDSCGGAACPSGQTCIPDPGTEGSDCQSYGCDDPAYEPKESRDAEGNIIVVCQLIPGAVCKGPTPSCTATVFMEGPTKIRPGATCMWSADLWPSSTSCAESEYIYHWFAANQWVGIGEYYSGGKPDGVLNGYPWKLRVEAWHNGVYAGKREIEVKEDANAPVCFY